MKSNQHKDKSFSIEQIKDQAQGRETEILEHVAGIPAEYLDEKHHPCPKCGGTDRFRLIDPEAGAVFCNQCFNWGNGDFLAAICHYKDIQFSEAVQLVADYLGLKPESPVPTKKTTPKKLVKTWVYSDQAGEPRYRVKRFEWIENGVPKKSFFQERHVNGKWELGLKGVEPVPYNWQAITERCNEPIYLVEGEKCCDVLSGLRFLATTASGGSNSKIDWSKYLAGRDAVIFPDDDRPGYEYARNAADQLYLAGCRVKIVFLPNLPHKGDIADWIGAGGTREELVRIVKETPLWDGSSFSYKSNEQDEECEPETTVPRLGPVLLSFDEIEETEIEWLLQDVFPRGMVSVLAGKPGQGKSFLTCWLASIVSGDDTVFFRRKPVPNGSVIICNAEDNAGNTIKKRLRQNGANLSKVKTIPHVLTYGRGSEGKAVVVETPITLEMVGAFRLAFKETPDCRLLIVDPVSAFWGEANDQKNAEVRVIVSQLKKLAEETGVAIVLVTHLNKSMSSDSSSRITGSGGLPAAGRANWLLSQDESGLRTVSLIKTNVSENGNGFTFRIIDGRVTVIDQEIAISADEVLQAEIEARQGAKGRKPEQVDAALEWLENFLADGEKPAGSETDPAPGTVRYESNEAGLAWRTIRRAADSLKVVKRRDCGVSFWSLPPVRNPLVQNDSLLYPDNSGQVACPDNSSTYETTCPLVQNSRHIEDSGQVDLLDLSERPPGSAPSGPKVYDFAEHMSRRNGGAQ